MTRVSDDGSVLFSSSCCVYNLQIQRNMRYPRVPYESTEEGKYWKAWLKNGKVRCTVANSRLKLSSWFSCFSPSMFEFVAFKTCEDYWYYAYLAKFLTILILLISGRNLWSAWYTLSRRLFQGKLFFCLNDSGHCHHSRHVVEYCFRLIITIKERVYLLYFSTHTAHIVFHISFASEVFLYFFVLSDSDLYLLTTFCFLHSSSSQSRFSIKRKEIKASYVSQHTRVRLNISFVQKCVSCELESTLPYLLIHIQRQTRRRLSWHIILKIYYIFYYFLPSSTLSQLNRP